MEKLLTIGITSYKRVNELIRCINSVQTKYIDDVEILISEDCSPLSDKIARAVEKIKETSPYEIRFTTNEVNLGYDMNLGAIIKKSKGKYIFFLSDDDSIYEKNLDEVIGFLKKENKYGVIWSPFVHEKNGKQDRYRGKNINVLPGERSASKYIYDSILFSGLIFRKDYVKELDSSRFKNMNYFQVYMFLTMLYKYGGYYSKSPSVLCVGDGENAYGISESSGGDVNLANRKNIKSNLAFNKTLIKVIRIFDADNHTKVINEFAKQYSLHSYTGLSTARKKGKKFFKEYWDILISLDIKLYPIVYCYYWLLLIFGSECSDKLLLGFRKILKKEK